MSSQKIMLLGAIGVGKTSLARKLVFDRFDADYKGTLGVDIFAFDMDITANGTTAKVQLAIWDLDGDLGTNVFQQIYSRGASSALVIGDMTRPATQETMLEMAQAFNQHLPGRPLAFVLNKADLVENVDAIPIPQALITPQIPVIRTSAKTGFNVSTVFETLARVTLERGL